MKIITRAGFVLFFVVVVGLMAAMVAGYLNAFEFLVANIVWFGLYLFYGWVLIKAQEEVDRQEAEKESEDTNGTTSA